MAALRRTLRIPVLRHHLSAFSTTAAVADPKSSSDPVSSAKSAIRSKSDPDQLVSLFESVSHDPSFFSDRSIYRITIKKLARRRRHDLIERVLEGAKSTPGIRKSEGFLIRLISLYSEAGMVDQAVRAFEAMPDLGVRRTERSLCALLSAFLNSGHINRLKAFFDRAAEDFGVAPSIASYNILIRALCNSNKVEDARALLDQMPEKGVEPDIVSYNTVLDGYTKVGDYAGFDKVLKEIIRKNLSQTAGTYNCRIAALCSQGKSCQAEELLHVMKSNRICPNKITFSTLIAGFCKEGNTDSALEVFERMKGVKQPDGSDMLLDSSTYILLLQGLIEKGEFVRAVEICKECLEKNWAPPFETVRRLVDGLIKSSRVGEAREVIRRMRKAVKGDARDAWKKIEKEICLELINGNNE